MKVQTPSSHPLLIYKISCLAQLRVSQNTPFSDTPEVATLGPIKDFLNGPFSLLFRSASLEEWPEPLTQREDAEAQDDSKGKRAALVVAAVIAVVAVERQENS